MIKIILKSDISSIDSEWLWKDQTILLGSKDTTKDKIALILAHEIGHAMSHHTDTSRGDQTIHSETQAWEWVMKRYKQLQLNWTDQMQAIVNDLLGTYLWKRWILKHWFKT